MGPRACRSLDDVMSAFNVDIDGLVIVQAVYGDLSTKESTAHDAADDGGDDDDDVDDSVADEWSRTFPSSMDATVHLVWQIATSNLADSGSHVVRSRSSAWSRTVASSWPVRTVPTMGYSRSGMGPCANYASGICTGASSTSAR